MSDEVARHLANLRQAFETGTLDEDTYRAAIAALGGTPESLAMAQGSGATAATASATNRGMAIGLVQGNVYVGPPPQDPVEALRIYRQVLVQTMRHLPLRGVDLGAGDPTTDQKPLGLANVYVDLDTTTQIPLAEGDERSHSRLSPAGRETRPLGALEAALAHRHLVLLGDPGSGKSTFVNHLAHCLAAHALEANAGWLAHLPNWPAAEAETVPIVVILRDFIYHLPEPLPRRAEPKHLWDFILARLDLQNLAFVAAPLQQMLEQGQALLLLDGLDEVAGVPQRLFIRDAVMAFARRYPRNRYLITCRILSYQPPTTSAEPDLRLPSALPTFELAPFDSDKIDRFITAWYGELGRLGTIRSEEAGHLARQLQQVVRRPDLWRLAPNPLLLTVMALVHTHQGRLPEARALLYEETIDILLWRWEQVKRDETPPLRELLLAAGRTDLDLKRTLWQLAFEAHAQSGQDDDQEKLADIGELKLERSLAALKAGDRNWAQQMIEAMKLRAGLLLERVPERFSFPHRTFQEYLAGAYLAAQGDFARQAAGLAEQGALWREVILLAVGRLVYLAGDMDKPLALVGELCPARLVDQEHHWRKVWLAGAALVEIGVQRARDSALGQDLSVRVREHLAELLTHGRLAPRERAAAGAILAKLGDPRPGVTLTPGPSPSGRGVEERAIPDLHFCYVPAGPFWMGSPDEDELAYKQEKPLHQVNLPYDYWLSRYPVTVAQFRAFVEAGGYREPRYWVEAQANGDWREGKFTRRLYDVVKDEIKVVGTEEAETFYDFGEPYNLPNHPVVGITWYEVLAFCRWLEEQLAVSRQQLAGQGGTVILGDLLAKQGYRLTLPSEAEWEKAARGPDKRRYPWGDEPDPNRANYEETGIGTTSAVGCFPGGASPYGCEDMSGNVWEWTRTLWGKDWKKPDFGYPYNPADRREDLVASTNVRRVLRGGAFFNDERAARCAYRDRYLPFNGFRNDGFRIAVVGMTAS